MKLYTFAFIASIVFLTACNNSDGSFGGAPRQKTAEELRLELKLEEENTPARYLDDLSFTMKPNKILVRRGGLFREPEYRFEGYLIEGVIKNTATLAKFKDAVLNIQFLSKTKSVIQSNDIVVYEFFNPSSSTPINIKVEGPEGADGFALSIKGATAAN